VFTAAHWPICRPICRAHDASAANVKIISNKYDNDNNNESNTPTPTPTSISILTVKCILARLPTRASGHIAQ
jgi:hypothetical protein